MKQLEIEEFPLAEQSVYGSGILSLAPLLTTLSSTNAVGKAEGGEVGRGTWDGAW